MVLVIYGNGLYNPTSEPILRKNMIQFNITAQVYNKLDDHKQTIFMNEIISASSKEDAMNIFQEILESNYEVLKVYSVESI